jgi:hypothetical protein
MHRQRKGKVVEIWIILGFLALWLAMQLWILPALGVPT